MFTVRFAFVIQWLVVLYRMSSNSCINGVKGPSPLMLLMFFNMVTVFDYMMRAILLGVTKLFHGTQAVAEQIVNMFNLVLC